MTNRVVVCLVLLALAGCSHTVRKPGAAAPLDGGDAGEYLLVQPDGNKGELRYRLLQGEPWKFEHQLGDGTWDKATCSGDCQLRQSSPEEAARFMSGRVDGGQFASCVHNIAYAFCRVSAKKGARRYAFISLTTGSPIAFDLERVADAVTAPAS